jgi:hypothetical protein
LYGGGIAVVTRATVSLTDSLVDGNTSSGGGGLDVGGATLSLVGTTVSNNAPLGSDGGGVRIGGGATVVCTDGSITGNQADRGGGVWLSADRFEAARCDLGDGASDNLPEDVWYDGDFRYGASATFVCAAGTCE